MRAAQGLIGLVSSESTFRRVRQALDADVVDAIVGGWAERWT